MKKVLLWIRMLLPIAVITLFSVLVFMPNVNAASFKYEDFDWDEFSETNKDFWETMCRASKDPDSCHSQIIESQRKFYVKLYKSLAKMDENDLHMDDRIFIETAFFELSPKIFSDDSNHYSKQFKKFEFPFSYIVDEADFDDPDVYDHWDDELTEDWKTYFENESDTIKVLVKNMVGYHTTCYGVVGDYKIEKLEDGSTRKICPNGGQVYTIKAKLLGAEEKCADVVYSNTLGFWEYFTSYFETMPFLNRIQEDEYLLTCKETVEGQPNKYPEGYRYVYEDQKSVEPSVYFNFLANNKYFDRKPHLQHYFYNRILKPNGVDCMTSSVCVNSLEAKGLYEDLEEDIIEVRQDIILNLISVMKLAGIDVDGIALGDNGFVDAASMMQDRSYWPIGGPEIEVRNGVKYADGEPTSTKVISYSGRRTDPVTGRSEIHYGIDIEGKVGVTNVIAIQQGVVEEVYTNCKSGDYDCNEGYGNYITISHKNGNYSVYAHMGDIDSAIRVGSTVDRGQYLGKVGDTGKAVEKKNGQLVSIGMLHFEIREGENSRDTYIDPLNEVDPDNPRPQISGTIMLHQVTMTKEEFIAYVSAYKTSKSIYNNLFVPNAGNIYDIAVSNNLNPVFVIVRAFIEDFDPGSNENNYWGIGCNNGAGRAACTKFSSFEEGIKGLANISSVKNYESTLEAYAVGHYAYIGNYWYKPGSWSLGGCAYFPYVKEYLSSQRAGEVSSYCDGSGSCSASGSGNCLKTTDEDQLAYAYFQTEKERKLYAAIFGA